MNGGGAGISELNPNPFETGLDFDSPTPFGFGAGNEDCLGIRVWV